MRKNKMFSMLLAVMFTAFIFLSGIDASAATKKISPQAQVVVATKYVVAAEKYVKIGTFTVKWAQDSVLSAQKQVNKVTYKTTRNLLNKRLNNVQVKINVRARILAEATKAAAEQAKVKNATTKVAALEALTGKDLTILSNLASAEALINPAKVEVAKIAPGTTKTSLQNRINTAVLKITVARTAYNEKSKGTHNVTTLASVILSAQTLHDGATEGVVDGNYSVGSKDSLQTVINVAKSVIENATVTSQANIDNTMTVLNAAVQTFKDKLVITHDATTLSAIIVTAQTLHDGAIEGTADGSYAEGSKDLLQTAITAAKAVADNAATTSQTNINNAAAALNTAVAAFNSGLVTTHDVTTLSAIMVTAQALYDGAVEGTSDGNYAVGSKNTLQTAIAAAKTVVDNAATTSQTNINNAVTALNAAVATFNSGLVATHDATTLSAVIVTAQALHDGATEGTLDGNYAIGSKDILQTAITAAKTVADNAATTSQTNINNAVTALNAVVATFNSGLVVTHNATTLSAVIVTAQALHDGATEGTATGNYAVGSMAILQTAINAAKSVADNAATTSQSVINNMVDTLNTAVTTFNNGRVL